MSTSDSLPYRERRRSNGRTNVLTDAEKFQLWKELQSIQAELVAEVPSVADVAVRMSRCLDFPVTVSNIESAIDAGVVQWTPREVEERRDRQGQALGLPQMRSTLEDLAARVASLENEREDEADALEDIREQVESVTQRFAVLEERLDFIEAAMTTPAAPAKKECQEPASASTPPSAPVVPRLPPMPLPFVTALAQPIKPMIVTMFRGILAEQAWTCGSFLASVVVCVDKDGTLLWAVLLKHVEGCHAMSSPNRKLLDRKMNRAGRVVRRILHRVGKGEVVTTEGFEGASAVAFRPLSEVEAAFARTDTLPAAVEHFHKNSGAA